MNARFGLTLGMVLLLIVSADLRAQTTCVRGKDRNTSFPFLGAAAGYHIQNVNIHLSDSARSATFLQQGRLADGVAKWATCASGDNTPGFTLSATDPRPSVGEAGSLAWRSTMLIDFKDEHAPVENNRAELAHWSADDNSITLYGKCPTTGTYGLPCFGNRPGGAIRWDDPGLLEAVVAHEIGHSLGLGHDECPNSIMRDSPNPGGQINPEHCRLVEDMNNPNLPCNEEAPAAGESHPCETPSSENAGGSLGPPYVEGEPDIQDFCTAYNWSCHLGGGGGGTGGCTITRACVTVSDFHGTSTQCSYHNSCAGLAESGGLPAGPGLGPRMQVYTPQADQTVNGTITITGWAMDFVRVASLTFGIDGNQIAVQNYTYGFFDAGACTPPLGSGHSACILNSGFSAQFDTRQVGNGRHVLQVVAVDAQGWPTAFEVPFFVDNCPDTQAPAAVITSPAAGSTLSGTATITANASDNVGVTKVQLYVDSVLTSTDTTAPYSFAWNTTSAAGGSHNLKVKARDACGNVGPSPTLVIAVDNGCPDRVNPAVTLTAPGNNQTVEGQVGVTVGSSDNVGVTRVEIYRDGALAHTATSATAITSTAWTWDSTAVTNGNHTLLAKGFDACGNQASSATVTVNVQNIPNAPPELFIGQPIDSSTVSGTNVTITGWVLDADGIASVTASLDGQNLPFNQPWQRMDRPDVCSAVPVADPDCPNVGYRFSFNSGVFTDGFHLVRVVATDTRGASRVAERWLRFTNYPSGFARSFFPAADTYVRQDYPSSSYGHLDHLSMRGTTTSRTRHALLKFNLSGLSGTVRSARLYLRETGGSSIPVVKVWKATAGTWDEATFTWNHVGTLSWQLMSWFFDLPASATSVLDVTDLVQGNGELTIGLMTESDAYFFFGSKEHLSTSVRPLLEVISN